VNIKVILADDHTLVRDGLRALLEQEPDIEVIAEAMDGRTIVRLAGEMVPDVIVMDVAMPDMNGIEATRRTLAATPQIKVLALSMHSVRRFVAGMLEAGASGYLVKDCAAGELVTAIRAVAGGRVYVSPAVAGVVVEDYVRRLTAGQPSALARLSDRERETLQLLAEGKTTKEIAARLHVSAKTVETHRQHLMEKLDLHSVAELTKLAIREGLTSLER